VVTGGPGGGKTTAADLFRRELGERVVVVPEAATLLFMGGFPRSNDAQARKAAQIMLGLALLDSMVAQLR
jgi:broad-specificity NMP kinase